MQVGMATVEQSVQTLCEIGINFVAIDFDVRPLLHRCKTLQHNFNVYFFEFSQQTFVSNHSRGHWYGSAKELASYVRPEFLVLVPELLRNSKYEAFHLIFLSTR